jgi:prepilin-type N-terminal cleavage/methylation domain-containing protein/prepilin-type processing-associated H-X9-DG protein
MHRSSRHHRAFSLTELLVVIGVILVLASLIIVGSQHAYNYALQVKCQHRLEQIGMACAMYANSHRGKLPESACGIRAVPWYTLLLDSGCLDSAEVLDCPKSEGIISNKATAPPDEVSTSILATLRWFKERQNDDGSWTATGPSYGANNTVTGLALLLFVMSGCNETHPPEFADTVRGAVEYLASQNNAGNFKGDDNAGIFYVHGIVMMGLCEASRRLETPSLRKICREAAQDGIDYMASKQSTSYGGWGYSSAGADISVSGWCFQALRYAMDSGLDMPSGSGSYGAKTAEFLDRMIFDGGYKCNSELWHCYYSSSYCQYPANNNKRWSGPDPGTRLCHYKPYYCNTCWKRWTYNLPSTLPNCPEAGCGGTVQQCSGRWRCTASAKHYFPLAEGSVGAACSHAGCSGTLELLPGWVGNVGELLAGKCPICRGTVSNALCPNCRRLNTRPCVWGGVEEDMIDGKCPLCYRTPQTSGYAYNVGYQIYSAPWNRGNSIRRTAIGYTIRRYMDRPAGDTHSMGILNWILSYNGAYYKNYAPGTDIYTLYYLTLAMHAAGEPHWSAWQALYRQPLMDRMVESGPEAGSYPSITGGYASSVGIEYGTALAALSLGHMADMSWARRLASGACSYGYNNQVGKGRGTTAADTIVVMDYFHWEIDRDDVNPTYNDEPANIALRHDGQANALLGDGSVRCLAPKAITAGMWTPAPGD